MQVKVIYEEYAGEFEKRVQKLLDQGYEIKECFCGVCHDREMLISTYKAIMIKD